MLTEYMIGRLNLRIALIMILIVCPSLTMACGASIYQHYLNRHPELQFDIGERVAVVIMIISFTASIMALAYYLILLGRF